MITTEIIPGENNEIITLAIAKKHLRIESDFEDEDEFITLLIGSAQNIAENYMQRAVGVQSLVIKMDKFQSVIFEGSSNDNIEKVEYYEPDATVVTVMAPELYQLRKSGLESFEVSFKELPVVDDRDDAVIITVSQGYSTAKCPKAIKSAMLLIIADLFERREDREQGNNPASVNLMRPFRKW